MTRGRDRPHRLAGMWQEQECRRRRLSTAPEQTQFGVHQTEFAPEPCSAAAALLLAGPAFRRDVPAVGVAQAPADHDIARSTAIERGLAINFWPVYIALANSLCCYDCTAMAVLAVPGQARMLGHTPGFAAASRASACISFCSVGIPTSVCCVDRGPSFGENFWPR